MTNSTVNAPILTQSSINAHKEPFCKMQDPTTITVANTLLSPFNPSAISDKDLLKLCQEYGGNSKAWKRKFEELLPEVLKRHLYKGRKFTSIYEFSAKLCGLSHDSVDNVIRIYEQLKDKPILRSLVVEFGWSKLRIVASIATPETDASWAEKVRVLPSSSLVTFVRDLKRQEEKEKIEKLMSNESRRDVAGQGQPVDRKFQLYSGSATINRFQSTDQKDLQRAELDNKSIISPIFGAENLTETRLIAHFDHPNLLTPLTNHYENFWPTIPFKLSPETHFRLRKLKARIEKGKKEKISFNQLFETMLSIIENKEKIVKKSRNPYGMAPLKLCRA